MTDDLLNERLARLEEKLDRVAAFQEQFTPFIRSYENLSDLGRDLSLLMGPGVRLLTEELGEIETGFQIEDLFSLLKKLLLSLGHISWSLEQLEKIDDLGRDLSLLVDPGVRLLTEELGEIETGFQIEDLFSLLKKLLLSSRHITWSLEQLENLIDWWRDVEPLLMTGVPRLVDKLDDLEQKGIFRINRAVLNMYAKLASVYTPEDIEVIGDGFAGVHGIVKKFADPVVIQSIEAVVNMYAKLASVYTPEDIESIGDGFVRMHGIVKKFADPEVIDFLEHLTELPAKVHLEEAKPVGPVGLMFRMMGKETKQGLGVALELTKALGKIQSANGYKQPAASEEGQSG